MRPAGRRPPQHPADPRRPTAPSQRGRRPSPRPRLREQPDGRAPRARGQRRPRPPPVFQFAGRHRRGGRGAGGPGAARCRNDGRPPRGEPRVRSHPRPQMRRLRRVERHHGEPARRTHRRSGDSAGRRVDPHRSARDVRGRAAADEPGGRRDRVSADRHPDQRFQGLLHPPRAADLREPVAGQRRGGPDYARGEIAGRDPERRPSHRDAGAAVRRPRGDASGRSRAARVARERRRVVHGPGRERRDRAPLHDGPRHPARFPRAHAQDLVQHGDCREEAALDRLQRGSVPRRYRDDGPARGRPVRADPRRGVGTSAREQREARVPRDRDLERRRHTVTSTAAPPTPRFGYRWTICALLFAVTTINYMDRQVLSILAPTLQRELTWSESQYAAVVYSFTLVYAFGFLIAGRCLDRVGVLRGFATAVILWSVAAMSTAFARTTAAFAAARGMLGLGESANFPGSIKSVGEWFPKDERALATGIFNAGTNTGAIVTPLVVPWIALTWGWRWAFVAVGFLGFLWLALWLALYASPERHPRVSPGELAHIRSDRDEAAEVAVPWIRLLAVRQTWAFAVGKLLADPIWWFYLYWLPKFLDTRYGIRLAQLAPPLIVVYVVADVGSVGGGWLSSGLIQRGWTVNRARKTAMLAMALLIVPTAFAPLAGSMWTAVLIVRDRKSTRL